MLILLRHGLPLCAKSGFVEVFGRVEGAASECVSFVRFHEFVGFLFSAGCSRHTGLRVQLEAIRKGPESHVI